MDRTGFVAQLLTLDLLYASIERSETGGDYVFTSVCVSVRLCALSPIGLNGRNDVLYATRAWKVENISVRTICRWKRPSIGFLKI